MISVRLSGTENGFSPAISLFLCHHFIIAPDSYSFHPPSTLRSLGTDNATKYGGADKFLARPTSRCILFDGENISFDVSLVVYIRSTNIPLIMIINRIYETQNLLSL